MFDAEDPIRVAAGILKKDDTVLLCQRSVEHRYALKWEFPGGKSYEGEPLAECLLRELEEELDIVPTTFKELKTIHAKFHDAREFIITFYLISAWDGEPVNRVFEDMRWVKVAELPKFDLLEGTIPILQFL